MWRLQLVGSRERERGGYGGHARGNFMPERIKLSKDTKGLRGHVKRIVWLAAAAGRKGDDSVNSLTDKCLELAFAVKGVN